MIKTQNGHDGVLHMKLLSVVKTPHTPPTEVPEMYSSENNMKWISPNSNEKND